MSISSVNSLKSTALGHDHELVGAPAQGDVDLFNSAMRGEDVAAGHLSDGLMGALSEHIGNQSHLSQQAMRSMKAASGRGDPTDMMKMSRSLSQYSLQMALTTKVVNKGAQALDKLTNLQ